MVKDSLVCFSLTNLCFLNVWNQLQQVYGISYSYWRKEAPSWVLLSATLLNVLLVSSALWLLVVAVRRWANPVALKAGNCLFLLALIVPVDICRAHLLESPAGKAALLFVELVIVIGLLAYLFDGKTFAVRAARSVVLILSPLLPITALNLSVLERQPEHRFSDKPLAPMLQNGPPSVRMLWLVFDGMDQRLAFEARPATVKLPELDGFRSRALYASRAYPAARYTHLAIPGLTTGRRIADVDARAPDELMLTFRDSEQTVSWGGVPTIFSRARAAGLNTGAAGSHLPYCRLLSRSLTACLWRPGTMAAATQDDGRVFGLLNTMSAQLRQRLVMFPFRDVFWGIEFWDERVRREARRNQIEDLRRIQQEGLRLAADPRFGLVLVHLPLPHPFGIFDRFKRRLTVDDSADYLDNLALADRTLGEFRRAMERAGTWEHTVILLSSDHPLRTELWKWHTFWSPEEAQATGNREYPHVPFLVKLPQQDHGLQYEAPFNTVLAHDLTLAILKGEISTPEGVASWLDEHRLQVPIE